MKQPEAMKLLEAERILHRLLDRKSISHHMRRSLALAVKLVAEAIAYEDDEVSTGCTDD